MILKPVSSHVTVQLQELDTLSHSGSDLMTLAEDSPAMLWRGDREGRCIYLNRTMREFWGLTPADCLSFNWASSLLEADRERVFGPFSKGMAEQRAFICEGRYHRSDGAVRVLRTRAFPFIEEGVFAGMIGVNEDITELREAEAQLEAKNEALEEALLQYGVVAKRFEVATNILGLVMSEHDEGLRYVWQHNLAVDALGKTPSDLVGPEVGTKIEAILKTTLNTGEPQSEELALIVNTLRRWFDIQTAVFDSGSGRRTVIASALDVTVHKLNEEKLQVLARELAHRVKNVFSVVQGIVRQSARSSGVSSDFVKLLEARLNALAQAQDGLMAMRDDQVLITDLVQRQLSHVSGVRLEGPNVPIPGRVAPYLALAVHELSTNAVKYGSLKTAEGRVDLSWQASSAGMLTLLWKETGGTETPVLTKKGFGSTLLTTIFSAASHGSAQLEAGPGGLVWQAEFPVSADVGMG